MKIGHRFFAVSEEDLIINIQKLLNNLFCELDVAQLIKN